MALGKPALQIDTHNINGVAAHATDGVPDPNFGNKHCTHTKSQDSQSLNWWAVDLQKVYAIDSVTVTNRADCCRKFISLYSLVYTCMS